MFATLRTTCSRCMPRGSRPRTAVCGGPRGTPGAHAPSAFPIYSENGGYQAQPRGGCCRRCNGARRSKRVGGYALAQPLRMANARAEAVDATVNRAGPGLRTCTRRKPARASCNATAKSPSGARSGRAGSLKDEGNRARRPLRGADVVRLRAHQPMSGLTRTTEGAEHREGRGPTAARAVRGRGTDDRGSTWGRGGLCVTRSGADGGGGRPRRGNVHAGLPTGVGAAKGSTKRKPEQFLELAGRRVGIADPDGRHPEG